MRERSYQLKIIEKKSRPVIWRRALIPYGVTFSVLAYLLNEIMELEEPLFFQMKFADERLHLREKEKVESADFHAEAWFDVRNAKNTFIEDYFKEGTWFTYSYGGEKEYRVEIEKIWYEYAVIAPILLGFSKADSFSFAGEESYEEHTHRLVMNCMCERKDKAEFMTLSEIYRHAAGTGMRMLPAMKEPKSEKENYFSDYHHTLTKIAELFTERAELERQIEELKQQMKFEQEHGLKHLDSRQDLSELKTPVRLTQRQFFKAFNKNDLLDIAKSMHIRVNSTWKKSELVEITANEVLRPSWFRKQLLKRTEAELALFRKLCKEDCWYIPEEEEWDPLEKLADRFLVFIEEQGRAAVSAEMKELFEQTDTPAFRKEYADLLWFRQCLYVVKVMYGSVPITIFRQLYSRKEGMEIDTPEIVRLLDFFSGIRQIPVIKGDRLIAGNLLEEDQYKLVEEEQKGKEFYIPDPEEVEKLYEYTYPAYDPEYQRYTAFLRKEFDLDDEELSDVAYMTYRCLANGGRISDVAAILDQEELAFSSQKAMKKFVPLIIDLSNHTRMLFNCGFKPDELAARRRNVSPRTPEKKMQKIYPNDPCPCGSGKKYKKCCGRK